MILASLLLAAFAINLDTTIVNVALPTLVRELHASNSQLQWIVDAYNLVFAALLLAAGQPLRSGRAQGHAARGSRPVRGRRASRAGCRELRAADRRPLRDGPGRGDGVPRDAVADHQRLHRARRAGAGDRAVGGDAGLAIALGPIFGGWLLGRFSWSSIFFAMAPVAAVGAALVACFVPTSRDPRAPRDRPRRLRALDRGDGAAGLHDHRGARHGWGSARTLAGFAAGAALLAAASSPGSAARASRCSTSSLFRNPRFTAASAAVTVSFFTLFGFIFLITQYFQFIKGYGPLSAGVHLLPVASSVGVASVLGTQLAVRFGTKLVVASGLLMMACFYAWVATAIAGHGYGTIAMQMVALRHRHGPHERPCHGGDHGRRARARRPASARRSTTRRACSAGRSGWP